MNARVLITGAMSFAREVREGVADISGAIWGFLRRPSAWPEKMREWAQLRRDRKLQALLNRQIRRQFIDSFNRSAAKKMSVEVNDIMRQYKSRNGFISALLRPYEIFSYWNLPAKIATAYAFFRTARILLMPAMGLWGVVVPLGVFVGARMALVSRDTENKRQEEKLAREGFVVPCTFEVSEGRASVMGREIAHGTPMGFPLLHRPVPEWVVSQYDSAQTRLGGSKVMHAAEFEALRLRCLPEADREKISKIENDKLQQCVYALSILFPGKTADERIAEVEQLSKETISLPITESEKESLSEKFSLVARPLRGSYDVSLPEAVLRALEPFCLRGAEKDGLAVLSGKVSMEDLRWLVELKAFGHAVDGKRASEVVRMLKDARFSDELSFRQMAEAALLPEKQAAAFDELWKDREYRTRFGFNFLMEMTLHYEGWGGVALRLARHDYTRALSGEQIKELAQPENEHWARAYHQLRLSQKNAPENMPHETLKKAAQDFGLNAGLAA